MAQDFQINEIFELFSKFNLNTLSDDWVRNVIDSDYTEVETLPIEFEQCHSATNFSGLFQAQLTALRLWVDVIPIANKSDDSRLSTSRVNDASYNASNARDDEDDGVNSFWVDFSKNVKIKSLMSLVCYYVHVGQKYDAKQSDRELASQSACLYFLILCVPGSNAFRVFHPVLYLKCLDVLRLANKLNIASTSPKKGNNLTS